MFRLTRRFSTTVSVSRQHWRDHLFIVMHHVKQCDAETGQKKGSWACRDLITSLVSLQEVLQLCLSSCKTTEVSQKMLRVLEWQHLILPVCILANPKHKLFLIPKHKQSARTLCLGCFVHTNYPTLQLCKRF